MESFGEFVFNLIKGFAIVGFVGFSVGFASLIVGFIFEYKNIREEGSKLSTGVGNALLVLHSFLEPGRKPQTEQVIIIKKRRTPVEKKVIGLESMDYYNLYIKGYRLLKNKRFRLLKTMS
jgi:hypothetical protein